VEEPLDSPGYASYGDAILGIDVAAAGDGTPTHRLVALGDSFTQNFQSGAVSSNEWSFPAIIARSLSIVEPDGFRYPLYGRPGLGLPLDMEELLRILEKRFGDTISWLDTPAVVSVVRRFLKTLENHWERGSGASFSEDGKIPHLLASYGFDFHELRTATADSLKASLHSPTSNLVKMMVEDNWARAALVVLSSARRDGLAMSLVEAAQALGDDGTVETGAGDGIRTLLVWVGLDQVVNVLSSLQLAWQSDPNGSLFRGYNIWHPDVFSVKLEGFAEAVSHVRAEQVLWVTLPRPSLFPVTRGVGEPKDAAGYSPYYTRPWIPGELFKPRHHPALTGSNMQALDNAVHRYNLSLVSTVRSARLRGRDWRLVDVAGLLEDLANATDAGPAHLKRVLPPPFRDLEPPPDTRILLSDGNGRLRGGFFSLDGIHLTTIGQALVADRFLSAMQTKSQGYTVPTSAHVDFAEALSCDRLVSSPPALLTSSVRFFAYVSHGSRGESLTRHFSAKGVSKQRFRQLVHRAVGAMLAIALTLSVVMLSGRLPLLPALAICLTFLFVIAQRFSTVSSTKKRERFFDGLVERRGMFAPILYALNTIALSLGLFSLITHLSYRQGVGSLSTSDRDISSVDIALLYLWEFTGSIPLADINGTFDWQQPVSYHGPIIAAQILFFKIAIIVPVVVTISEAWKSRDGRNQRYRRGRAAKLARTFGLD